MKKTSFIIISCTLGLLLQAAGQDTARYSQTQTSLFGNSYTFIRKNKQDKAGQFFQLCMSDDGICWYGAGSFTQTRHKIFLQFDTSKHHNRTEIVYQTSHRDTLYVYWFDWWHNDQVPFGVRAPGDLNPKTYNAGYGSSVVHIPKKEVVGKKLAIFPMSGTTKLLDLDIPPEADEIRVFANDTARMITFNKTKETLRKRENGFITKGMWAKSRRSLFVQKPKSS
ncbi:hypothetical protein [Paraflavitalea sp. CAU 1676]|uniref:hypothetical protein n=1 Tax=Paraflavitalea sp. CAU 1676 TaxID=3032598 RepID=UPI0023DCDC9B|nr:hypothetical protein [Paraflavitalea sp. CAU 1676]MDF2188931.1 hypothetical protein [Paraflavitalea sp. CAU 1676]